MFYKILVIFTYNDRHSVIFYENDTILLFRRLYILHIYQYIELPKYSHISPATLLMSHI